MKFPVYVRHDHPNHVEIAHRERTYPNRPAWSKPLDYPGGAADVHIRVQPAVSNPFIELPRTLATGQGGSAYIVTPTSYSKRRVTLAADI